MGHPQEQRQQLRRRQKQQQRQQLSQKRRRDASATNCNGYGKGCDNGYGKRDGNGYSYGKGKAAGWKPALRMARATTTDPKTRVGHECCLAHLPLRCAAFLAPFWAGEFG